MITKADKAWAIANGYIKQKKRFKLFSLQYGSLYLPQAQNAPYVVCMAIKQQLSRTSEYNARRFKIIAVS